MIRAPLTCEDVARLGQEIYDQRIAALMEPTQIGWTVAIEVATGKYAIGDSPARAKEELGPGVDGSQVYLVKVGSRTFFRHGIRRGPQNT